MNIQQGCVDRSSEDDFQAEFFPELFGNNEGFDFSKIPTDLDLRSNRFKASDQGKGTFTCVSNSIGGIAELMNEKEFLDRDINNNFLSLWGWMESQGLTALYGSSLQAGCRALIESGMEDRGIVYKAKLYFKIPTTPEAWVEYLSKGFPIHTGSDWGGVVNGFWIQGQYGHATCKCGYQNLTLNEDGTIKNVNFIGINSQGADWGAKKDGSFYVRKEDVVKFYSSYVFVDEIKKELTKREIMRINRMKYAYKMFYLESDEDPKTKNDSEDGMRIAHKIAETIRN